jgi:hypothetical protein
MLRPLNDPIVFDYLQLTVPCISLSFSVRLIDVFIYLFMFHIRKISVTGYPQLDLS